MPGGKSRRLRRSEKNMKKGIICLLTLFLLAPVSALADGCMIPYNYEDVYEPFQLAMLVYDNGQEDLYLKINYEGETNNFVWVVPTPHYPEVVKADSDIFIELSVLTMETESQEATAGTGYAENDAKQEDVIVHEQKQVGIYAISILSAAGADGLYSWLNSNGYKINEAMKEVLDFYVAKEWYFTAMRIEPEAEEAGISVYSDYLEPVKISFVTQTPVYPLQISQLSTRVPEEDILEVSPRTNEVLIYILADSQYQAPLFKTEYVNTIRPESLSAQAADSYSEDYDSLLKIIDKEYTLTKLRRTFARSEMDEDVYFLPTSLAETPPRPLNLYLFSGESCPHCAKAKTFLEDLADSDLSLTLKEYEIYNNEANQELYKLAGELYNVTLSGVPLTLVGFSHFLGFDKASTTGEEIKERIDQCQRYGCEDYLGAFLPTTALSISYAAEAGYEEAKAKVVGSALSDRLEGMIVIKVEDAGKAYYINPVTRLKKYLGRPADAFTVMREQGIGISNANIARIPAGMSALSGVDTDNDGLSDIFEDAIGTNKQAVDTDKDGYSDQEEISQGYNPLGSGELILDNNFSKQQAGKIFLQVENKGEAWYINPSDSKRYFLGRPADAFQVMRELGLGISNEDFEKL